MMALMPFQMCFPDRDRLRRRSLIMHSRLIWRLRAFSLARTFFLSAMYKIEAITFPPKRVSRH